MRMDRRAGLLYSPAEVEDYFITFSSTESFTLEFGEQQGFNSPPTFYYSTDKITWNQVDFSDINASNGVLYLYGVGNRRASLLDDYTFRINTSTLVDCSGNIEFLLDKDTVLAGQHPPMDSYCYYNLFSGNTYLSSCPKLPATTLTESCYENMFYGCVSLTSIPELPAIVLPSYCYKNMFNLCTSIELFTLPLEGYNQYRIPLIGTITSIGTESTYQMFNGYNSSSISVNTSYSTNATIIPAN